VGTVRDEERHPDPFHHAVEMHAGRFFEKIVHVSGAEDPLHMDPVVRDRVLALTLEAFVLNFRPVVIGTPDGSECQNTPDYPLT
jgi:hypothetical protein